MFILKGGTNKVEINDETEYYTKCTMCGGESLIDESDFEEMIKEMGLYGWQVYCSENCNQKATNTGLRVIKR